MSTELLLPLIMRWLHIVSAIVAVGGTFFMALVLNPAIRTAIPEDAREAFRHGIMKRWKMVFHPLIVVFLASGFYNYIAVTSLEHEGQSLYHILFGMKFLVAVVFFAVVIVATSTMSWSQRLREKGGMWGIQIILALAVVMIAGFMKMLPEAAPPEERPPVESTEAN